MWIFLMIGRRRAGVQGSEVQGLADPLTAEAPVLSLIEKETDERPTSNVQHRTSNGKDGEAGI